MGRAWRSHACRNVNHRTNGLRSEHATANAIDIAGFGLGGGRQVTVKSDWKGDSAQRSAFLRALMDEACDFFAVVLSPNYNQAHHDHFHFDMGPIGHADEGLLIHMTGAGLSIS